MSDLAAGRMPRGLYAVDGSVRKNLALIEGSLRSATIIERKIQYSRNYGVLSLNGANSQQSVTTPELPIGPDIRTLARWFGASLIFIAIGLTLVTLSYFVGSALFNMLSMMILTVGSVLFATVLLANERNEVGLFRE